VSKIVTLQKRKMKLVQLLILMLLLIGCKKKATVPGNPLDDVISNYLELKDGFIKLDTHQINNSVNKLIQPFEFPTTIQVGSKENVLTAMEEIQEVCKLIKNEATVEGKLNVFKDLTKPMELYLKNYNKAPYYVQHCPMAEKYSEDSSVYWISNEEKVLNPFFPKTMLQCGEVTDTIQKVKFLGVKK
jgi:membrane fusion protein, copper/silver efflux system